MIILKKRARSPAILKGRLFIGLYDGPSMDRAVQQYGLTVAEKLLKPYHVIQKNNLVVMSGRNLHRNFLYGDAVTGVEYYAVGTDNTAAVAANTTLGTEVFRAVPTQLIKSSDGSLTVKLYVASGEANGNSLVECGPFCNGATGAADSGTLYARAIHTAVAKTAAVAMVYSHELIFVAG